MLISRNTQLEQDFKNTVKESHSKINFSYSIRVKYCTEDPHPHHSSQNTFINK